MFVFWISFCLLQAAKGVELLLSQDSACFAQAFSKRSNCTCVSFFCVDQIQVEAERTEVLRLAAELNDLRAKSEQEAIAAKEREAALKAMLASETEVRCPCQRQTVLAFPLLFIYSRRSRVSPVEQLTRY